MDLDRSLPCQHPNVFGCPNHGVQAREYLRIVGLYWIALRRARIVEMPADSLPIPYALTDKGRAALAVEK